MKRANNIQKEAFLDKAKKWFKVKGGFTIGFPGATVMDFINYMEKD